MKAWLRTSAIAILAAAFVFVVAGHSQQDADDIGSLARDLRKSLKDIDKRLSRLEALAKQMSKEQKKNAQPIASSAPAAPPESTASRLLAAQTAYQRGRVMESALHYKEAISLYSQAVEGDPGNDAAFLHRAICNLKTGNVDLALSDVDRSLAIQPNNGSAYALRGEIYGMTKDYDRSIADFNEAFMRNSTDPNYLVSEARIEEERGNFKKAAEIYGKATQIKPDSADLYVKRAEALKQINEQTDALEQCSAAIRFSPADPRGYACRADSDVRTGQLPQAISDLNTAIRLNPNLPEATRLLPVVKQLLEVNQLAEKTMKPDVPISLKASTSSADASNRSPAPDPPAEKTPPAGDKLAIAVPRQAAQAVANPDSRAAARNLTSLGRNYCDRNNFPLAIAAFTKAVALDPNSALAFNSRGYAYLRIRDLTSAVRDFTTAITINSAYANAYGIAPLHGGFSET